MSSAIHISGIRVGHVESPDRGVRVNRPDTVEGPITWRQPQQIGGAEVRIGRGRSGLAYLLRRGSEWRVSVVTSQRQELPVGSARMQDHAQALAGMWEQAVLSGRIDMS